MLDTGLCANCDRAIDGPAQAFCPACGQSTPAHRTDWHSLRHDFEHGVLHMDRGLGYSLKGLMLRPGRFMRDYLEGRRSRQVKPLPLLMIMAAVVVFLGRYLLDGDLMGSAMAIDARGATAPAEVAVLDAFKSANDWMNHHFAAVTLALLPLEALAFKLAFRRVGGLNYPEWLVVTTFLTVQTFVLWGASVPLQRVLPGAQAIATLLAVAYGVVSLVQLFKPYPAWKSTLRAALGYALFFGLNGALTLVAVAVVVLSAPRA